MKGSTITIELKEGVSTREADIILRKMINSLDKKEIGLITDAHLTSLIASVEQKGDSDSGDLTDEDDNYC